MQTGTSKYKVLTAFLLSLAVGCLAGSKIHPTVYNTANVPSQVPIAAAQVSQPIVPAKPQVSSSGASSAKAIAAVAALGAAYAPIAAATPFESLGEESSPLYAYFNMFTPLVDTALGDNDTLIHWLHPVNMGIVLFAMGGYGAYLGWQIRAKRLAGEPAPPAGLAGATHPLLMGLMAFLFFLGAQGGVLFTLYEGRPLLASDHSTTAIAALGLLAVQAFLGKTMGESDGKRSVHAYFGSAIMLLLVVHAALGLKLGLST